MHQNTIVEKLFTVEDKWNAHKLIGLGCLLSYGWRMSMVFTTDDMGFRTFPEHTLWTVLLHASLHLTSFQFVVPRRRIREGSRIWPEFRLHSLCFSMRNLLLITLFWFELVFELEPLYWASMSIVFGNMLAVDLCSVYQRETRSSTIRNLDTPRFLKYIFSSQQFLATSTFLFGPRCSSIQFMNALIVQITPFMMTLRRKNLVSHAVVVVVYGALLGGAFFIGTIPFLQTQTFTSILIMAEVGKWAFVWRTNPWLPPQFRNKYLIWTVLAAVVHFHLRDSWMYEEKQLTRWQMQLMAVTTAIVIWNGYAKCTAKSYNV